ncbi:MAG: fibronectin type III domain-containing protein, partial [Thermoplasmata archaeon]
LECYACHAIWTPQCYGCHAKLDARNAGFDWVSEQDDETFAWSESRSYLRWETPVLGINAEGKVAPFIPGCQVIFTYINDTGGALMLNHVYTTVDGTSGIAHNPIQPHTISASARTCESCHTNKKTLGLGSGIYNLSAAGVDIDFELERIVDEEGVQIQATSHGGARPFNKTEQEKIGMVGVCIGCHDSYSDPIWENVTDAVGFAENSTTHNSIMGIALTTIPGYQPPMGDSGPLMVFMAVDGRDGSIHLKWNFSGHFDIDHYELYWSATEITNVSDLHPNSNTTDDSYAVEGLRANTTYYFAIIAVDDFGNRTGFAFSNAVPTQPPEEAVGEGVDEETDQIYLWSTMILIILLIVIAIIMVFRRD